LDILFEFIMGKFIRQFSLPKIWLDINYENFLSQERLEVTLEINNIWKL